MSSNIDVAFTINSNNVYDISIGDDGDLLGTPGLDTAILMSGLCEVRADESEVTSPEFRRGDWSNELNDVVDYEVGSKLWLLDQARSNQESIDAGNNYLNDGFSWLIDDEIIKNVETTGELTNRGITFTVLLTKQDDKVEKKLFEVFDNTRTV
jgi:phage gp46-like protein